MGYHISHSVFFQTPQRFLIKMNKSPVTVTSKRLYFCQKNMIYLRVEEDWHKKRAKVRGQILFLEVFFVKPSFVPK